MTTQTDSWTAAVNEGLAYFAATMHAGHSVAFVAQSWEEGGFSVNDNGDPIRDSRGNTVAKFSVEQLDPACAAHVNQVNEWYGE